MLLVTFCTILLLFFMAQCSFGNLSYAATSQTETFAPIAINSLLSPDVKITADLNSNKCIDIGNNKRLSKLTLQYCSGQKNQRFWMSPFNGAIRSIAGHVSGHSKQPICQWSPGPVYDCNNSAAQKFKVIVRNGKSYIQKQGTNYCVDLTNANLANNTPVQLLDCNWNPSQRWQFKK